MNYKRGFLRLWIVIAVACWAGGGLVIYDAQRSINGWSRLDEEYRNELSAAGRYMSDGNTLTPRAAAMEPYLIEGREQAIVAIDSNTEMRNIALHVMGVPIYTPILYFIVLWVRRGFTI